MLPADGAAAWVDESLAPQPRDVYDETKLAAEEACREAARAGLACTSLRMSRCFPEEPRLVAIYRLYRGVDAEDVAQAHELALTAEAAASRSTTCRRRRHSGATTAAAVRGRGVRSCWSAIPGREAEFASRGWQLPRSIDRVYVVDKAIAAARLPAACTISPRCSGARPA